MRLGVKSFRLDRRRPEAARPGMGAPAPTESRPPQAIGPSPTTPGLHALVLALKARDEHTWRHSMENEPIVPED